jgi:hypothetical protein
MLRNLLGLIRLELVTPDIGRPFYRAVTTLDTLALTEESPPAGAEGGSNSLQRWDSFQMPRLAAIAAIPARLPGDPEPPATPDGEASGSETCSRRQASRPALRT